MNETTAGIALRLLMQLGVIVRPYREPTARIAWVVVVAALHVLGFGAYLLLGEINIGRRRIARLRAVLAVLHNHNDTLGSAHAALAAGVPER